MAFCEKIVNEIDSNIVASVLSDKRFQNRAFAGLCYLVPGKFQEGKAIFLPAKVSTIGECNFIVPDDTFNLITYHRILSNTYGAAKAQFGDGVPYQSCLMDMVLTVIGFTSKLNLTAEQLEAIIMAGFPNTFTTDFRDSIQMIALTAQVTSSNFDGVSIFNTEYRGETYFLKPEQVMVQIRYKIESIFKPECLQLCCDEVIGAGTTETTTETDANTGGVVGGTERLEKDEKTIKQHF